MSYFPEIQLKDRLGNGPDISGFGQVITGERQDQILCKFVYNNSSYDVTPTVSGTGATANSNSMAVVSSGTGVGAGTLVSVRSVNYRPAHEIYTYFTALYSAGQDANTFQRIGLFDSVTGFWIGYSGISFGISKRNASTDNFITQANFNLDKLDGTGNSGFTLDTTKINQYKIQYGWLGVAPVVFSIYAGQTIGWIPFHYIDFTNSQTTPSISSPSNHITCEAGRTSGTGVSVYVSTGSWSAGTTEGRHSHAGHRVFSGTTPKTLSAGVESYIATFQNKLTFLGKNNKILTVAVFFGASTDGTKNVVFNFYKNSVLTTPTYVDVDTNNSVTAIDTTAAAFTAVNPQWFVPAAKVDQILFDTGVGHIHLELHPGETMTITGTSAASSDVVVSFRWEEYFS